jgi:hypothetical protein
MSATITWDIVHTLLRLLGFSSRSSFHQCPTECVLILKMVLTLIRFRTCLNFSEVPLTCGIMTVPRYVVSEERRLLLDSFIMESTNSCGYSLSIWSYLIFLISLLKSVWSWHVWIWLNISSYERRPFSLDVGGWTWRADNDLYEYFTGTLSLPI